MRPLLPTSRVVGRLDIGLQSCAAGEVVIALTDAGTEVEVWRPLPRVVGTRYAFFCHGHATLSHHLYGYTIPGESLETVLREEWTRIDKKPTKGDIVVFRNDDNGIAHSARIEAAVHSFGSSTVKTLSTKNGTFEPLLTGQTIAQVEGAYGGSNWRVAGTGCCAGTVKQYYRRNNRAIDAAWSFP